MVHEKELIVGLVNGDERAFRQIYDLYVKKVYHFTLNYVKEKSEAEDIAQNVFMKIWERRNVIDKEKSFAGFIFTVTYRIIIDYFRQNSTKFSLNKRPTLDQEIPSLVFSDDLLNRHQLESFYDKALQALPPKRKEIFLLSRHNGLTNKQIAEKLDISVKTVENQMTAALASLKASFSSSEPGIIIAVLLFFFY